MGLEFFDRITSRGEWIHLENFVTILQIETATLLTENCLPDI